MTSLGELQRELAQAKARASLNRDMSRYEAKKKKVKQELFDLKYGGTISKIKHAGHRGNSFLASFNQQRKKGKGVGGFLQKIANNQRM
jgi:hypothetical protein